MSPGNTLVFTDAGLTNNVTYFYQVTAINAVGESGRSNEVNVTAGAPVAPSSLQATPIARGIQLEWQPPASTGDSPITGYRIYRGSTAGSEVLLTEVGDVLVYLDSNVSTGQTYFYQVSAVNAFGEGPRGGEASATVGSVTGPGNPPFPWIPVVGAVLLAVVTAALLILQHTRLVREDLLQRRVRMLLFEYTRTHPGSSFSQVRNAVGLKNGVAAYHLRVLEKQGLVHSRSHRRHRWFYPNGDVSLWRSIPLSPLQRSLLNAVRRKPGLGIRELARTVDRRSSSVAYNVKGLVREGVLRTEREGRKLLCYPTESGAIG